jgi:hypothetical protein
MDLDDNRPFLIQAENANGKACVIPWWLAEIAYGYYAERYGTDQSLERLNDRGGFGRKELVDFIRQLKFKLSDKEMKILKNEPAKSAIDEFME